MIKTCNNIEIDAASTLEDFFLALQASLDFENDHLYEFYTSRTKRSAKPVSYDDENGLIHTKTLEELYPLEKGHQLFYLFDYGDSWTFKTRKNFPSAVAFAMPMNPQIMLSIQKGPNQAYADEYASVNKRINELSEMLASEIRARGFQAQSLAASVRTDTFNTKRVFPHKTAATRASLSWIGRHCQLVTRPFGSWVRLGTVFSDIDLPCGPPMEKSYCGSCMRCVDACPGSALKGKQWYSGLPREEILDVDACDQWKKEHYFQYHKEHNCGVCSSVCPYGLKSLKNK